ncbi:hypothetical protein ANN_02216 [Periplaneta americana]|uniref:DUF4817 domain-containing protein n=1 Tax=Periplaneta americana TaxID=6978 RepID=A0ABQ8TXB3_PERAM|nr:hypothetical protein ANN_02216 [Periplaneta americana]
MSPGSSTESYPAFARIGLRENPGKNLNQVTCPDQDSNPGHLVSQPDALTVTPQREFGVRNPPKRNTVLGLVNKLETTGSLVSEKGKHRSSKLPTVVVDTFIVQNPAISSITWFTYEASFFASFFDDRIISRNLWPPRSPDLTTPDFFLWGYLKDRVYATRPQTLDDLKHNITQEIQAKSSNEWPVTWNDVLSCALCRMEDIFNICYRTVFDILCQRLFLVKQYWITNSITATQRAYQREFGVRNPPKRNTILGLVNKLETTGSLVSEKGKHRSSRLPTVVVDVRARLEQSPKKSLRRLSQETGYTYSMCQEPKAI